jgi:hypothetical protein
MTGEAAWLAGIKQGLCRKRNISDYGTALFVCPDKRPGEALNPSKKLPRLFGTASRLSVNYAFF